MEAFINLLKDVDFKAVENEVKEQKIKNSAIINKLLLEKYPSIKSGNTKSRLLKITQNIIERATITDIEKWKQFFRLFDVIIKALYDNENYTETIFSIFRKPVRVKYGDRSEIFSQSVFLTGASQQRRIQRKEEYKAEVKVRNAERNNLDPLYFEDIIQVIQKNKYSNDPYKKAIAVLLATGSRSIEVFKVSKYTESKDPTRIVIKGLAKDKGDKRNLKQVVLEKPLINMTGDEVVKAVEEIREDLNLKGTNAAIAARTNAPLNKAFRDLVQILAPNNPMTAHTCRYIYGNLAYIMYAEPKGMLMESYIQEILGHASPESTKSYLGINMRMKDRVVKAAPEHIKALFENEIASLRKQVEKCCPKKITVNLDDLKNSRRREMTSETKINNVIEALKRLKENKVKMNQRELRAILEFSGEIMSKGYKLAKEQKII